VQVLLPNYFNVGNTANKPYLKKTKFSLEISIIVHFTHLWEATETVKTVISEQ